MNKKKRNLNKIQAVAVIAVTITTTPLIMINEEPVFTKASLIMKVVTDGLPAAEIPIKLEGANKLNLGYKTNKDGYAIPVGIKQSRGLLEIKLDPGSYNATIKKKKSITRKITFYLGEGDYREKIINLSHFNHSPKSVAGDDVDSPPLTPVILDAKGSFDPDFPQDINKSELTEDYFYDFSGNPNGKRIEGFRWRLIKKPDKSRVVLKKAVTTKSSLKIIPDVEGIYDISLEVTDGLKHHSDIVRINCFNTISNRRKLPFPRGGHTSSIINDSIYVIGGWNRSFLNRVDRYHIQNDSWSHVAPLNIKRNHHVSISYQGKIYVFGGHNSKQKYGIVEVEQYDPTKNTWKIISKMQNPRYSFSGGLHKNKVYLFGGINGVKKVDVYDLFFNRWENRKDMPIGRFRHSVNMINGLFYIIGGKNTEEHVHEYCPENDIWIEKKSLPTPRYYHSSIVFNDRIYVTGGHSFKQGQGINTVEAYDPRKNSWKSLLPLPFAMDTHSMNAVDSGIFIIGGEGRFGKTLVLDTNMIYRPQFVRAREF